MAIKHICQQKLIDRYIRGYQRCNRLRSKNPVMNQILNSYKPIWSIKHAISLMGWDFETYMPRDGTEDRGVADSQLQILHKDLLLNKNFVGLVEEAKNLDTLDDHESGILRILDREICHSH